MPRAKRSPKPTVRSRAVSPRVRVLSKPVQEIVAVPTCSFCHEPIPCMAQKEESRILSQRVTDQQTGNVYVVSAVGHLLNNAEVYARVKGYDRPILASRLR